MSLEITAVPEAPRKPRPYERRALVCKGTSSKRKDDCKQPVWSKRPESRLCWYHNTHQSGTASTGRGSRPGQLGRAARPSRARVRVATAPPNPLQFPGLNLVSQWNAAQNSGNIQGQTNQQQAGIPRGLPAIAPPNPCRLSEFHFDEGRLWDMPESSGNAEDKKRKHPATPRASSAGVSAATINNTTAILAAIAFTLKYEATPLHTGRKRKNTGGGDGDGDGDSDDSGNDNDSNSPAAMALIRKKHKAEEAAAAAAAAVALVDPGTIFQVNTAASGPRAAAASSSATAPPKLGPAFQAPSPLALPPFQAGRGEGEDRQEQEHNDLGYDFWRRGGDIFEDGVDDNHKGGDGDNPEGDGDNLEGGVGDSHGDNAGNPSSSIQASHGDNSGSFGSSSSVQASHGDIFDGSSYSLDSIDIDTLDTLDNLGVEWGGGRARDELNEISLRLGLSPLPSRPASPLPEHY
ncbi:hypothetical protein UCRNP2_4350 [Neofusicoccum parvum UCRNP2]|uniref:Uncharacterized protein n=1 Tax=Botryosphaeria parva (strain UCR-NP2) TaxID=1287680 RepID=R1GBF9_BOTPV|nr:hypothetical protein UCRNP2_4350 [Neofusicoccum parvum UCRNP2]